MTPRRVLEAIHERVGETPVCAFLIDLDEIAHRAARIRATLPPGVRMYYAMKANAEHPVLDTLARQIDGFEVASGGEIAKARGVSRTLPLIFGGPGKTDVELEAALDAGIERLHVESAHELQRVAALGARRGTRIPVLLRVNLTRIVADGTLHMSGVPTQFGIDEADVPSVTALARTLPAVDVEGFHFHSVSNQMDAAAHCALVAKYLERAHAWARDLEIDLRHVNAGGGIGVRYDGGRQFDWTAFTTGLAPIVKGLPHGFLNFECGRYLVAEHGWYATEVLDLKTNHGRAYAIVRGGTHHFRLPVSWRHSHPFSVTRVETWLRPYPRPTMRDVTLTVCGQLCTPKDVLAFDAPIDEIAVGDVIVFEIAGAYGWAISHHDFLSHPHPEHVYLQGTGPISSNASHRDEHATHNRPRAVVPR